MLTNLHSHQAHQNRKLHYDEYFSLLLLAYFNPVIRGLRQIQQVSDLEKVQRDLGVSHVSLGSFSEASQVFDPKLPARIFADLAQQVAAHDAQSARHSRLRQERAITQSQAAIGESAWQDEDYSRP